MAANNELPQFIENTRQLLQLNAAKFGLMVERQVQAALLPTLVGPRSQLEPDLWRLLVLLLDGHEAAAPPFDDSLWERACAASASGLSLDPARPARFPRAAAAVVRTMTDLREVGVLPRPKLPPSGMTAAPGTAAPAKGPARPGVKT